MDLIYDNRGIQLFCGDNLQLLTLMEPNSVDMIFADPPYNISNGGTSCSGGERVSVDKAGWDKSQGVMEDYKGHLEWIQASRRVLKPSGTIWITGSYHSIYQCGMAVQLSGFHILNDISWFKPNAPPNLGCRCFTASHESLIWARKDKKAKHTFNYLDMKNGDWHEQDDIKKDGKQMRSVWRIPATNQAEKRQGKHPTQKPIALLDRIVLSSTNEGDLIVDPFLGSGTTAKSAQKHNRLFVGCDLEIGYVELSQRRCEEEG